jgi:Tfp pilus assembly protein PilF
MDCIHTYIELQQYSEAKDMIEEYLQEQIDNADLLYQSARVNALLGNSTEAMQWLKASYILEQRSIDELKKDFSPIISEEDLQRLFI